MSTKKIRESLELLRDVPGRSPILAQVADAAEAEIEALEKAAQAWADAPTGTAPKEVHDLMWAIVREKRR